MFWEDRIYGELWNIILPLHRLYPRNILFESDFSFLVKVTRFLRFLFPCKLRQDSALVNIDVHRRHDLREGSLSLARNLRPSQSLSISLGPLMCQLLPTQTRQGCSFGAVYRNCFIGMSRLWRPFLQGTGVRWGVDGWVLWIERKRNERRKNSLK